MKFLKNIFKSFKLAYKISKRCNNEAKIEQFIEWSTREIQDNPILKKEEKFLIAFFEDDVLRILNTLNNADKQLTQSYYNFIKIILMQLLIKNHITKEQVPLIMEYILFHLNQEKGYSITANLPEFEYKFYQKYSFYIKKVEKEEEVKMSLKNKALSKIFKPN